MLIQIKHILLLTCNLIYLQTPTYCSQRSPLINQNSSHHQIISCIKSFIQGHATGSIISKRSCCSKTITITYQDNTQSFRHTCKLTKNLQHEIERTFREMIPHEFGYEEIMNIASGRTPGAQHWQPNPATNKGSVDFATEDTACCFFTWLKRDNYS